MTVQEILDVCRFILKDSSNAPKLTNEEYNVLLSEVNLDLFWRKMNVLERADDFKDAVSHDKDLSVFKTNTTLAPVTGIASLPADYIYCLGAVDTTSDRREIEIVSEQERSKRMSDKLAKKIEYYPIATIYYDTTVNKISILPTNITAVDFFYLRKPTDPVYATTVSGTTGLDEYASGSSTQLEWHESIHPEFIRGILNRLGVNTTLDLISGAIQNINDAS